MAKATETEEGEWFPLPRRGWRQVCCSCGLTHRWEFRVTPEGKIEGRVWVCSVATANARRSKKKTVVLVDA